MRHAAWLLIGTIAAGAACKAGGLVQFSSSGGGGASGASGASTSNGGGGSSTSSSGGGSTSGGTSSAAAAPARSDERVAVREGGGFALTEAQREADPYGDKVYSVVPLGRCADPGEMPRQNHDNLPPIPAQPADPWLAVTDGQPAALPVPEKRLKRASVYARTQPATCDGAHDHCFRDCTWIVRDPRQEGIRTFVAAPAHRRPDGMFTLPSSDHRYQVGTGEAVQDLAPGYDAYRTVPATRRLLEPGRMVAVLERVPTSEREAMAPWRVGKLYQLDWDGQTVQLVGSPDRYPLAATRVVVLTYRDGGAVELADGLSKDQIGVRADETIAPLTQ